MANLQTISDQWAQAQEVLALSMAKATYNAHLKAARPVGVEDGGTWVIGVGNPLTEDWANNRLRGTVERVIQEVTGKETPVVFRVADAPAAAPAGNGKTRKRNGSPPPSPPPPAGNGKPYKVTVSKPGTPRPRKVEGKTITVKAQEAQGLDRVGSITTGSLRDDPLKGGFIQINHYAARFWRPYVGPLAFALYQVLASYRYHVQETGRAEWPTIGLLSEMLGHGDRITITGRAASGRNKARPGLLEALEKARLIKYRVEDRAYHFQVLRETDLPLLTPAQVAHLPKKLQEAHAEYLEHFPNFDREAWENDGRDTRIGTW